MANTESSVPSTSEPSPQQLRDFADAVGAFLRTLNDCYWISGVQRPRFLPDVKPELIAAVTRVERSHNPNCRPIKNPDRGFWEIDHWPEPERLRRIYRWIRLSIDRIIVDWGLEALCSGQQWELRGDLPLPWIKEKPEGVVIVRYDPAVGWPPTVDRDLIDAMGDGLGQLNRYLNQYSSPQTHSIGASEIRETNSPFVVEAEKRIIRLGKAEVPINSHADFQVMRALIEAGEKLVGYAELLRAIKPTEISASVRQLDECPQEVKDAVAHVRKALKEVGAPAEVVTVKRMGFRLALRPA